MAITGLLPLRSRKQVGYVGTPPSNDEENLFKDHDLSIAPCSDEELQNDAYLAKLTAVVFTQNVQKPLQVVDQLKLHAKRLLDYDCRIFVRLAPNGRTIVINGLSDDPELRLPVVGLQPSEAVAFNEWQPTKHGNALYPNIYIFDIATTWKDVAKIVVTYPAGHAPDGNLRIFAEDSNGNLNTSSLSLDTQLLLRRAFWDCSEVHLVPMTDGLSGESVYRAYADLAAPNLGSDGKHSLLPYFIKIGKRSNIFWEYKNYEDSVRHFIPFHLAPRLAPERCCLGASQGIIVGDFVGESESLRVCASNGRATHAIASLFSRTLRGWHGHSEERKDASLADLLLNQFPKNNPPPCRLVLARAMGATRSLSKLQELFERCNLPRVRFGKIHFDLHTNNVLVRGTDAIIIDFFKHSDGPILYDPACLESGLLVESFIKDGREIDAWLNSILPLYELPLHSGQARCHPKDPSSWFYACVHQIRLYARQMECGEGQYAGALSVALLRKACKDIDFGEPRESYRAAAYVLAERVLLKTFGATS